MSFLDQILARLESCADQTLLTELRDSGELRVTGHSSSLEGCEKATDAP
jgi:hypothetical protein